ncbi:hypothetical protein [Vibrio sp. M260118]|uniref:hypothetical protein n=1 Tax=Vibrio sp. M260118 TaxID=3020896 RepID=UPI002F3FEF8F
MRRSQIIISKQTQKLECQANERLTSAYRSERARQEITEVELNRSKIVMIDENGNIKRVPILGEH